MEGQMVNFMEQSRQSTLLYELAQGKELAEQLRNLVNESSSLQTRQFLTERILCCYDKALSMLSYGGNNLVVEVPNSSFTISESPDSTGDRSPNRDVFKKRKTSEPRWTEQVRVVSGTGLESHLDDGYSWRKYGQKDILGSTFPRGYYRCTHRNTQGCLATKQVQRSDTDSAIYEVTYRGRHTCTPTNSRAPNHPKSPTTTCKEAPKMEPDNCKMLFPTPTCQENSAAALQTKLNLTPEISVKTEKKVGMNSISRDDIFQFFGLTRSESGGELDLFNEALTELDNNNFVNSISTVTSESNYFSSVSPLYHVDALSSELDLLGEIISAPTSATNEDDVNFSVDMIDFNQDLPEMFL